MRLFITGATGLIGRRLVLDRLERGDEIVALSRDGARGARLFAADANPSITIVEGDPAAPGSWQQSIDGCDAVIHLAGAGVADRRWSASYKSILASSRINSTRHVAEAILAADQRPRALLSGSAVGYYGETGDRMTDETGPPGDDFLADLCVRWEREASSAAGAGVRVVLLRTGLVLDDRGGALPKMARPFRWFVGGPIAGGRQFVPWVHWRDVVGLINLALHDESLHGPVNVVAPSPVTNRDFSRALGRALRRPSWAPAPRLALRLLLGEVANYAVMSQRLVPARAIEHECAFLYPHIEEALEALFPPANAAAPRQGRKEPRRSAPASAVGSAGKLERPPAPVKLLAIDIDGTMLTSSGRLSPTVVQAIRAAERGGCAIVLATGRPPRSVRGILQTLGTTSLVIANHGALVWDPSTSAALHHQPLDASLARRIIEASRRLQGDLLIGLESLDRWGTDRFDETFSADEARLMKPDRIASLEELLAEPITKLNLLREPVRLQRVLEHVREEFCDAGLVSVYLTNPHLIQITDGKADKGHAMMFVAQRMGVAPEQVMAIGDAINDLGMVRQAGFGVAVANAEEPIRAAAQVVVESNDEHGVAFAIQRYVLSR